MASQKLQASLPEVSMQQLDELCKTFGFTRSVIVAMAIKAMYESQKGGNRESK